MRLIIVTIFIVLLMIFLLLFNYLQSDIIRYKFNDFKEVKSSGLIEEGWIPKVIPVKLNNFKLVYDLDTNRICGSFTYQLEPMNMQNGVSELKIKKDVIYLASKLIATYCPENLSIIKIPSIELDLYQNDSFLFIVEQKSKIVIFIDGYL